MSSSPKNGATFPLLIENNSNIELIDDLVAWISDDRSALNEQLEGVGAILFRGFPLADADDFDAFAGAFDYAPFTYEDSLSNAVRINFTERVFTANEAPKDVDIYLHHEMAQTPVSPSRLFFYCKTAAETGGETPLCRSDWLFADLEREAPGLAKEFTKKGLRYTTTMPAQDNPGSGQGRSWMSTLSVSGKEAAELKLAELGYSWEWLADDALRATTPILPAVRDLGDGSSSFYNQLIAAYLGWAGVRDDPSRALSFGDGSAIESKDLGKLVELAERHTFDLAWQDGDVALVDNYRVMHGRRAFGGERKRQVLVAMGS